MQDAVIILNKGLANEKTLTALADQLVLVCLRSAELRECLESMCYQFACPVSGPALSTGGLMTLEMAFSALGWEDPKPVPELGCDEPGCKEMATCGWPEAEHYRRTCGKHYRSGG